MRTVFRTFTLMVFAMLTTIGFSACSDDDDEGKNQQNDNISIVGTWICENPGVEASISFYSDNTFYWRQSDPDGLDEEYGTYRLEGNIIIIRWDSDSSEDLPMRWTLQNTNGKWRIIAPDSTWAKK